MRSPTRIEARLAELSQWDAYLERLQVKAATTAGSAREQAEAAISELRRHRNVLDERLREVTSASADARSEGRQSVEAARDELERRAAELAAKLEPGGTRDQLRAWRSLCLRTERTRIAGPPD